MSDFTNCKLYGHHWRHYDVEQDGRQLIDVLLCKECGTVRRDKVVMRGPTAGKVFSRVYSYPDGYHNDKRKRSDIRSDAVLEAFGKKVEA